MSVNTRFVQQSNRDSAACAHQPDRPSLCMDELDHHLLMAWNRVYERCRADPVEARRRYDRTGVGSVLDRPARAWCVAVRASDTRLLGEPGRAGPVDSCARVAHEIELTGADLRRLGGPVWLRHPGLPLMDAAARLGRHHEAMRDWLPVRVGRTLAEKRAVAAGSGFGQRRWAVYEDAATGWGVQYVPCRAAGRRAGMEVPVVWHDGPLNPGAFRCRPPFRHWGSLWMTMAEGIPSGFGQVLERVPVFHPYGGGPARFRGWCWRCPGLYGKACGRLVRHLYAPLPVWTVGRMLGVEEGLAVAGLAERWRPGVDDRLAGTRRLACERCWRIKRLTFSNATGWNELVSYLSGGLLYGREVERPVDFAYERLRAYRKRRR